MTNYQTGLNAELLAAWLLRLQGYRIITKRCKTPVGEIDLIAQRGKVLVFVEVKARGSIDEALESVKTRQSRRIVRAAEYYMAGYRGKTSDIRFDVIAIRLPFRVKHIRAAFTA
jgi:putative endonuclease